MNYLEIEIDEVLKNLDIKNQKLDSSQLEDLIKSICLKFFKTKSLNLDPTKLKTKHKEHNPEYWKNISIHTHDNSFFLIVTDSSNRAWKIEDPTKLHAILSETTGFPFWAIGSDFQSLIYIDDHDCVSVA